MVKRMSRGARAALFAPLDQTGRVEAVTRRLVDAVTLGLLADAEQLPSETELAAQFGVSTVTVREALVALRQLGLVETRRGRGGGSFVRAPADSPAASWRERLRAVSLTDLRDVGDHYTAVAGSAARLAANAAPPRTWPASSWPPRTSAPPRVRRPPGRAALPPRGGRAAQSPRLTHQELQLQGEQGGLLWLPIGHPEDPGVAAHRWHRPSSPRSPRATASWPANSPRNTSSTPIDRLAALHLELIAP